MIRSMTGFGRADGAGPTFVLTVEVKSVNHRHLDIAVRLPSALAELELPARRVVQGRLERGRVDVAVQLTPQRGPAATEVLVDAALARRYVEQARALAGELGLSDEPPLAWVLEQPGVMQTAEAARPAPAEVWPVLEGALGRALDELVARRAAEGAMLGAELRARRSELLGLVAAMGARAPLAAARRAERLRERVRALVGDTGVDEARLAAEVAMWAQKTDISEELTRLGAHLEEVGLVLDKGGPVGRPLDFLIQELNREVNTLAAKADDLELAQAALAAKGILEKMREQVQNLE